MTRLAQARRVLAGAVESTVVAGHVAVMVLTGRTLHVLLGARGAAPAAGDTAGLPLDAGERAEVDDITYAAYAGDPDRDAEQDVRWLLTLLAQLDDRLTPQCACTCHDDTGYLVGDHCEACCQVALCHDCRTYARLA